MKAAWAITLSAVAIAAQTTSGQQQVSLTLREGTSMAAALSPDGRTLMIDLLGSLWTLPSGGGAARRVTDELLDPMAHLLGSLVGERDGKHLIGTRQALPNHVCDPEGDDACLARPGTGQDQQRAFGVEDGFALGGIQGIESVLFHGIGGSLA